MTTLYVICAESELDLVRDRVLNGMAIYGYEGWYHRGLKLSPEEMIRACPATLLIATQTMLASADAVPELMLALEDAATLIVVWPEGPYDSSLPAALRGLPQVDFSADDLTQARRELGALLPPVYGVVVSSKLSRARRGEVGTLAALRVPRSGAGAHRYRSRELRTGWNEAAFTAALERATACHDHARADALIESFAAYAYQSAEPYPAGHAYKDLQLLRQARAFELMIPLARVVMFTGTHSDRVLRLYAQALIETGAYEEALEVLNELLRAPETSTIERFEARGLIGRVYKQRYVESRPSEDALQFLRHAIEAYTEPYRENPDNVWHGINAATCLLRLARDTDDTAAEAKAQAIASEVLQQLSTRSADGQLDVWDCATRVEALLILYEYELAAGALEVYIHHPAMQAFEASSTLRQFEQLLELQDIPKARQIHARMLDTVERFRAHGVVRRRGEAAHALRPLVIRLRDPHASLDDIVELKQAQRLGPIITAYGSAASVHALLRHPAVISIEDSRRAGALECVRSLPFIRVAPEYSSPAGSYKETGDTALIAIIDDGIDLLHAAFRDASGAARILGIWDQNAVDGEPPEGFDYGHFHDAASIAAAIAVDQYPPGLSSNANGHGTHVASIAAGRAAGEFVGGVAPDARLLVVIASNRESVGYSKAHIDALIFIDKFATKRNLPVVVNLSQGMNAGAHDGKSALEVAFDGFTRSGTAPGRVIVKSAGNERDKHGHAKITLATASLEELRWERKPGADAYERIELWWDSADEIAFRLRVPDGSWSDWVNASAPELTGRLQDGCPYRLTFTGRHIDNGDSLLLIELGSATERAPVGEWLLELQAGPIQNGEVHAWIERTQGAPSTFVNHASEEMTLSIPATASSVISVAAVDAKTPIRVGAFSSYGPTRAGGEKPTVGAPGVDVVAARGGTIDQVERRTGTSMAAPHVAGAIALLLSRRAKSNKLQLGSNQIAKALCQKTQNHSGRWDRGQGWGLVDVAALLGTFSA